MFYVFSENIDSKKQYFCGNSDTRHEAEHLIEDLLNRDDEFNNKYEYRYFIIGDKKNEWINVKDRLPEEAGYYLVTLSDNTVSVYEWRHLPTLGFKWVPTLTATCRVDIDFWMPLPEPPKERNDE